MNTRTLCKYTFLLLLRQQRTNKAKAHTTKRFPLYVLSFAIHATFSFFLLVKKSFILRLMGGGGYDEPITTYAHDIPLSYILRIQNI